MEPDIEYTQVLLPVGGPQRITLASRGLPENLDIAPLDGGGFVASWTLTTNYYDFSGYTADNLDADVFFRLFDVNGAAVTAVRSIEGEDLDHPISAYAFTAQDGGFSIFYENGAPFVLDLDFYQGAVITEALVRVDFDAQGREIARVQIPLAAELLAAEFGRIEDVAVLDDATVVVIQRDEVLDPSGYLLGGAQAARFVQIGNPAGTDAPVVIALPAGAVRVEVAQGAGRGVELSYFAPDASGEEIRFVQQISADGVAGEAQSQVASPVVEPDGAALTLPDGGYAQVGTVLDPEDLDRSDLLIEFQQFDSAGEAVRGPITVEKNAGGSSTLATSGTPSALGISLLEDGSALVSWSLTDSYADSSALGGVVAGSHFFHTFKAFNDVMGTSADDRLIGAQSSNLLNGLVGNDWLMGRESDDFINGGAGVDTLIGGGGDDTLMGGNGATDLRDLIFGGGGDDVISGGYGNDALRGDAGHDTIIGGFGADTLIGGTGDDMLTGSALGDVLLGGAGDDFVNGGFGFDRLNGGGGADEFFHLGTFDHGSDWIQDYDAAAGDVLAFGDPTATRAQFQINMASTSGAGDASLEEVFVIYRPTGQTIWALVDGADQDAINLQVGGAVFDLMA